MSVNIFEQNAESNMMKIIAAYLTSLHIQATIVRGEDNHIQTLPLIIIHCSEGEEAVFQSGIYKIKLSATVKCDLDSGSPDQSAQLFGAVFDVFQDPGLQTQLNNLGGVNIKGLVLLEHNVADVGDRMWSKTVSMDFFGFAVA